MQAAMAQPMGANSYNHTSGTLQPAPPSSNGRRLYSSCSSQCGVERTADPSLSEAHLSKSDPISEISVPLLTTYLGHPSATHPTTPQRGQAQWHCLSLNHLPSTRLTLDNRHEVAGSPPLPIGDQTSKDTSCDGATAPQRPITSVNHDQSGARSKDKQDVTSLCV
jgi:hypothetical protein